MSRPRKPGSPFRYLNSSLEVIRLVVLMYVRFPLSLRNVEDLLFERGVVDICHETVRLWWNRLSTIRGSHLALTPADMTETRLGSEDFYFEFGRSRPGQTVHSALNDRLHNIGPQCCDAGLAAMPHRWVDNPIVASGTSARGDGVARRISNRRIGIEAGVVWHLPEVNENARHACKHLAIFNNGIEVVGVGQRIGQVIADFANARLDVNSCIPRASVCWIETHWFAGLCIREARIDELGMWHAMHEFDGRNTASATLFGDQPAARRCLDFGKQCKFIRIVNQRRHDSVAQTRTTDEPNCARKGFAHER